MFLVGKEISLRTKTAETRNFIIYKRHKNIFKMCTSHFGDNKFFAYYSESGCKSEFYCSCTSLGNAGYSCGWLKATAVGSGGCTVRQRRGERTGVSKWR